MQTQWLWVSTFGGASRVGLNYVALREVWHALGVVLRDRQEIFHGLQCMESAAIKVFNEAKN